MSNQENSYQSWRRDQLRLAAIEGVGSAGFWAYRKLSRNADDLMDMIAFFCGCIGAVLLLPIWAPAYLYFKDSVANRSGERIAGWENEAEALFCRRQTIVQKVERLASQDQELARRPLARLDKELSRLTQKIQRRAELWATCLYEEAKKVERSRKAIVESIEKSDQVSLAQALRENTRNLGVVRDNLESVQTSYGVEPYSSFWVGVQDRLGGLRYLAVGVGLIIMLAFL